MAETSGLLNRRTGYSRTEGSNPSVSATISQFSSIFRRWLARVPTLVPIFSAALGDL